MQAASLYLFSAGSFCHTKDSLKSVRHTKEGFLAQTQFAMQIMALVRLAVGPSHAQATVTNIVWYRLGENDPGASPAAVATNAIDFVSAQNLTFSGAANDSSDVSTSAVAHTGSSLFRQSEDRGFRDQHHRFHFGDEFRNGSLGEAVVGRRRAGDHV